MYLALIYNSGGGTALNTQIFCDFHDTGQGTVQARLLAALASSAVPFVMHAQRVRSNLVCCAGHADGVHEHHLDVRSSHSEFRRNELPGPPPAASAIRSAPSKSRRTRCTACRRCAPCRTFRSAGWHRFRRSWTPSCASSARRRSRIRTPAGSRRAWPTRSSRPCDEMLGGAHREPVRGGCVPGRRRHLAQHERQRGAREPRERASRRGARRVRARASERSRQHGAVDERRDPDGDTARRSRRARSARRVALGAARIARRER